MRPYSVLAKFYDKMMKGILYQEWVDYLEELFALYDAKGRKVLDLACGTGSVSQILANRGYQVIGLDQSPQMLQLAREKRKGKKNPSYFQGDMRNFSLDEEVNMVISLHDSINYMLKEEDLALVFSSVYRALHGQGLFLFDVNTEEGLKDIKEGTILKEGDGFYCFWKDTIHEKPLLWQVDLTFLIQQEDGIFYKEEETHIERAYSKEILLSLLREVGFTPLALYNSHTFQPIGDHKVFRYFFVVRKE